MSDIYHSAIPCPFSWLPNTLVNDPEVPFEIKGICLYLAGKPPGWVTRAYDLQQMGNMGRRKWERISHQMRELGFLDDFHTKEGKQLIFMIPPKYLSTGDVQNVQANVTKQHSAKTQRCITAQYIKKDPTKKDLLKTNNNVVVEKNVQTPPQPPLLQDSSCPIDTATMNKLSAQYGTFVVAEKLVLLKAQRNINNPVAWLINAIKNNYQTPEPLNVQDNEPRRVVPDFEETEAYIQRNENFRKSSGETAKMGVRSLKDALKGSGYVQ